MAKPILEKIEDELLTRLANINTRNGYEFTVNTVKSASRDKNTWNPQPLDVIVEELELAENEELSYPGNPPRVAFDAEFAIHGYARQLDTADAESNVSDGVTPQNMKAAILKAITNGDAASWHTFNSNAVTSTLAGAVPLEAPGHQGITFNLLVTYRHSELDPYTAG